MPKCEKCGARIAAGQKCSQCSLADDKKNQERAVEWGECPECGGISSSSDVRCAQCRIADI